MRRYAACIININEYLIAFPGAKTSEKIGDTELNEIVLNIMTNGWSKRAYVQGFDSGYITFKAYANMFERTEIAEYIYEDVVEPSFKNLL